MLNETVLSSKQFHGCNAFVNEIRNDKSRCTIYELVSYCTPVARVKRRKTASFDAITEVTLAPAARCSVTTCKQVSRFLREYAGSAGDTALGRFYHANGAGYKHSGFTLNYSVLFDNTYIKQLSDYDGVPRRELWFYQTYRPWQGFYNYSGFWVNGQHGRQV